MKKAWMVSVLVGILSMAGGAFAQGDGENNPAEFTLTNFQDSATGLQFKRPASWTPQDVKAGYRFAGGNEWLELKVETSPRSPQEFVKTFRLPAGEVLLGTKPFRQGKFKAEVLSSKMQGRSQVTGKPLTLLVDRWVFSPKTGTLVVLTVAGPERVFDWEGNRDMALSVRVR